MQRTSLSIILPFFKKLEEFKRVLPLNAPCFARPGVQVLLVLDENSCETELLALLSAYPQINWKVLVNDTPHAWRPPCKAINVGLKHAAGQHVVVCSPESAFVGDVVGQFLRVVEQHPASIALGRVAFVRFADLDDGRTLERHFYDTTPQRLQLRSFYGSVCGPRQAFETIGGYDETFENWGGDDDNLRVRLEMAGFPLLACPSIRLAHLSFEPRTGVEQYNAADDHIKCAPTDAQANEAIAWGTDFSRMALDYAPSLAAISSATAHARQAPPTGPLLSTRSRLCCRHCGRMVYHTAHNALTIHCPVCMPSGIAPALPPSYGAKRSAGRSTPAKIACVMQLHNEAEHLPGCLAHLRDYIDGFIALDDGSTDATLALLHSEPKMAQCLVNPPQQPHNWNERDNKKRLLQCARAHGFDWVICCDADERYETAFLQKMHSIAGAFAVDEPACISIALREMWNTPHQYRTDGVWGDKMRARFFSVPDHIEYTLDQDLHGQWYPDHIRRYAHMLNAGQNLYHFKSVLAQDRAQRRDFYNALDPDHQFQTIGYDYLAEEGPALQLQTIAPGREYATGTLPARLRKLLPAVAAGTLD